MLVPVIFCGGAGSRLWPLSRDAEPKQFINIVGSRSLFQNTLTRVDHFPGDAHSVFDTPVIVANNSQHSTIETQLRGMGKELGRDATLLLEPERRDSAAAVAAAAVYLHARDPDAMMLMLAADHVVTDVEAFQLACVDALATAKEGFLVTFGIRPDRPATEYGYIEPGARIGESNSSTVSRFVEKPDAARAQDFIKNGFLWNSGNFVFPVKLLIEEFEQFEPRILAAASAAINLSKLNKPVLRLEREAYRKAPKTSVDFAIMERTRNAAVVPCSMGWSDIGNWHSLWAAGKKDSDGNMATGTVVLQRASNCYVHSTGLTTVLSGVENAVVIVSRDAVLVTTQENAAHIKPAVEMLAQSAPNLLFEHPKVQRPWGWYETLERSQAGGFHVKRIMVRPGGQLSLQSHQHRSEHWVVVAGTATVTVGKSLPTLRVHQLGVDESIHIPLGSIHRLENFGTVPVEIIETQIGSYTGEDDIVRYEDAYERV
jgi:mannose-1-phosphate guanylyltransferase / mannose-6-phosphate isomerase